MRRTIVLFAIVLAAFVGCHREPPSSARLATLSIASRIVSGPDHPDRYFKTISFKLPEGFTAEGAERATLLDADGRAFVAKGFTRNVSSDDGETITAEFELPGNAKPTTLRMGTFDIDLDESRVTRRSLPQ